jgi:hypothetical protein
MKDILEKQLAVFQEIAEATCSRQELSMAIEILEILEPAWLQVGLDSAPLRGKLAEKIRQIILCLEDNIALSRRSPKEVRRLEQEIAEYQALRNTVK